MFGQIGASEEQLSQFRKVLVVLVRYIRDYGGYSRADPPKRSSEWHNMRPLSKVSNVKSTSEACGDAEASIQA